jgi:hypothetical protein
LPGVVVEGSRPIFLMAMQPLRPIFSDGCVVHSLVRDYGSTECKRRRRRFWTDPAAGRLETPLHPCLTPLRTSVATQKTPGWGDVRAILLTSGAVSPNLQSMGGNRLITSFGEVMPMRLGRLQ